MRDYISEIVTLVWLPVLNWWGHGQKGSAFIWLKWCTLVFQYSVAEASATKLSTKGDDWRLAPKGCENSRSDLWKAANNNAPERKWIQ